METLYWLTRLDTVNGILFALIIVGIVGLIAYFASLQALAQDGYCTESDKKTFKKILKYCKCSIISGVISAILFIFVPTTEEGYIIYGIGGTIDYIESNDKAKQLPDKVIVALDKWLDVEANKENKEDNNER